MTTGGGGGTGRPRLAAAVALVAILTFVVHLPAVFNDWTNWDDAELLLKDARWHGFTPENLACMWTNTRLGHYQPLTWMSYALDYTLWGVNAAGLHLTNVALHAFTAAFLAALLIRWLQRASRLDAATATPAEAGAIALAGLVWSLHPLRVEAVAWITARRDLLSAAFSAWSLWLWLGPDKGGPPSRARRMGATLAGAAAMLSKAQAMVLPALLAIAVAAELAARRLADGDRRAWWRRLRPTWPLWLVALASAAVSARAAAASGAMWSWAAHGCAARAIQSTWSIARHWLTTLWPVALTPLVRLPRPWTPWALEWLGPAAVIGGVFLSMPWWGRRAPGLALALLWMAAAVAPVSGWFQSGPQLTADRYTYVATWSLSALLAAVLLRELPRFAGTDRRPLAVAAGATVVGLLAALAMGTRSQIRVWRDPVSLWSHAVRVHPDSAIAHGNLAQALDDAGEVERALEHYATAAQLDPSLLAPRAGWATLIARLGDPTTARARFEMVLESDPRHEAALIGLANLDLIAGHTNEALARYEAALTAHPESLEAAYNLATLRLRRGEVRAARELLESVVARQPHHPLAWHNLGIARQREGDSAGAADAYRRALELAPELGRLHAPSLESRAP